MSSLSLFPFLLSVTTFGITYGVSLETSDEFPFITRLIDETLEKHVDRLIEKRVETIVTKVTERVTDIVQKRLDSVVKEMCKNAAGTQIHTKDILLGDIILSTADEVIKARENENTGEDSGHTVQKVDAGMDAEGSLSCIESRLCTFVNRTEYEEIKERLHKIETDVSVSTCFNYISSFFAGVCVNCLCNIIYNFYI